MCTLSLSKTQPKPEQTPLLQLLEAETHTEPDNDNLGLFLLGLAVVFVSTFCKGEHSLSVTRAVPSNPNVMFLKFKG